MSERGDAYREADRLRKRRARAARTAAAGGRPARPREPLLERHAEAMRVIRDNPTMTVEQRLDALGMVVWGRSYAPYDD